jgi:hypothetical protein
MKGYSIEAIVNGANRTFYVEAYDWADAQTQIENAYKGDQGYTGIVETTELSQLPGQGDSPTPTQQEPGVYSVGDRAYWGYIRENLCGYRRINPDALADAFRDAQTEGCYTTDQLMAISKVIDDAVIGTITRGPPTS